MRLDIDQDLFAGGQIDFSNFRTSMISGKAFHYENMPIQIYRKFHLQKLKIFR